MIKQLSEQYDFCSFAIKKSKECPKWQPIQPQEGKTAKQFLIDKHFLTNQNIITLDVMVYEKSLIEFASQQKQPSIDISELKAKFYAQNSEYISKRMEDVISAVFEFLQNQITNQK